MKRMLCLFVFVAAVVRAEEPQTPTYGTKVGVDVLQVPVWITDKNYHPVSSVHKEDLIVRDNGIVRQDYFLDEITQSGATGFPQSVLIAIDGSNVSRSGLKNVKDSLSLLLKISPVTLIPIALAVTTSHGSYRIIQNYTTDSSLLYSQLSKLEQYGLSDRSVKAAHLNQDDRISECTALTPGSGSVSACIDEALRLVSIQARSAAQEEKAKALRSWRSLARICDSAGSVSGYKHIFFLSDGIDPSGSYFLSYAISYLHEISSRFGFSPSRTNTLIKDLQGERPNSKTQEEAIRQLSISANLSRTIIHWIDTQFGRSLSSSIDSKELSAGESLPKVMEVLSHATLQTGGRIIAGSRKDPADLLADLPKLYVISVPLGDLQASGRREIRIGPQNKTFHCFYPLSLPNTPEKHVSAAALVFPEYGAGLNLVEEVNYFQKKKGQYFVILRASLPYSDLEPVQKGSNVLDQLEFQFRVSGQDGKKYLDTAPKVDLKSNTREFEMRQATDSMVEYVQSVELKSGRYDVSIFVIENQNKNSVRSQKLSLALPGESDECLSVSPIMLASTVTQGKTEVASPKLNDKGQILYGKNVYDLQSKRILPKSGILNGFYEVYNASLPSVAFCFRLYRDKVMMSQTTEREVSAYTRPDDKIISNFFSVPYKNLAPGKYELEIGVRHTTKKCQGSSKVAFEVAETTSF